MGKKLQREFRDRRLTPDELAGDQKAREQIAAEFSPRILPARSQSSLASASHDAILIGIYRHRNWKTAAFGWLLLAMGGLIAYLNLHVALNGGFPPAWLGDRQVDFGGRVLLVIVGLFAAPGMIYVGWKFLRSLVRGGEATVRIDAEGVAVGEWTVMWEDIEWIGGARHTFRPWRYSILLRQFEQMSYQSAPVAPPLDRRGLEEVLEKIRFRVQPEYPEMEVGGLAWWFRSEEMPRPG